MSICSSPSKPSIPGECYALRLRFGNIDPKLADIEDLTSTRIFLHQKNQFHFFIEQDKMPSNLKFDDQTFKQNMETIITIKKTQKTFLDKPKHRCEAEKDYVWSDCLDRLSRRKECQDPWNYKISLPQPVCTNLSEILESYGGRWSRETIAWDQALWDLPYMGRRELANTIREGRQCLVPCKLVNYHFDVMYRPRER